MQRLLTVVVRQGLEDARLALIRGEREDGIRFFIGDETHEGATRVLIVGVVVSLVHEFVGAERGTGEVIGTPERRFIDGVHLDHEAHGQMLVQLLLATREGWVEADPTDQRRRNGHDGVPGGYRHTVSDDRNAGIAPAQAARWLPEEHIGAELLGQHQGHPLQSADNALVKNEIGVDEVAERPGAGRHEQRLQGREGVGWLGEHGPGNEHAYVVAGFLVVGLRLEPAAKRDGVEFLGERMLPRAIRVDLGHEGVELVNQADDLCLGPRRHRKDLAVEPADLAGTVDVDVPTGAVARIGGQAQFGQHVFEGMLVG